MSDVERICHVNNERRKWAEEYTYTDFGRVEKVEEPVKPRNDKKRRSVLRTAATFCTMVAGGGAAFVGLGCAIGSVPTVAIGVLFAFVFLIVGARLDAILEVER